MNKIIITILSALALIGGFLIFYQNRSVPTSVQTGVPSSSNVQKWETKTEEQANVTVVITPLDLSPQSTEWKFDVGMNTHSVELDQDMTKSAVLIDDQGKEYKALNWNGPVGGHHREGVLTFSQITPTPKLVELKISGIGGVDRLFKWQF